MRRFFSVMLLIGLCFCLSAAKAETKMTKEQLMLASEWENIIAAVEEQDQAILWTLDQLEAYASEPTWPKLMTARAACRTLQDYLSSMIWPGSQITNAELIELYKQGAAIEMLDAYTIHDLRDRADDFGYIHRQLETWWFSRSAIAYIRQYSQALRTFVLAQDRSLAGESNYLYLSIWPKDERKSRWNALAEKHPVVFETYGEWIDDAEQLEEQSYELLNAMNEAAEAWVSAVTADVSRLDNNIFDLETMGMIDTVQVGELPAFLPWPRWYDPGKAEFVYFEEDGDGRFLPLQIGHIPENFNACVTVKDVSIQDLEIWRLDLRIRGISCKGETWAWNLAMDDYTLGIRWKDGTAELTWRGDTGTFLLPAYMERLTGNE